MIHAVIAILVLGIIIFIHELGHFLLAKYNGIGVLAFAIGFGPKLWKKKYKGTTYSLGLIPLGGYVRMVGDDPHQVAEQKSGLFTEHQQDQNNTNSEDTKTVQALLEDLDEDDKKLINDQSKWFLKKSYFAKASVVIAGPAFNFISAIIIAAGTAYVYGAAEISEKPIIGEIQSGLPAEKAGLQTNDLIKSIDQNEISTWEELAKLIRSSAGKELDFKIIRDNKEIDLKITAIADKALAQIIKQENPQEAQKSQITNDGIYRIGIAPLVTRSKIELSKAIGAGFDQVWFLSKHTLLGIGGMIVGSVSTSNLGGPISIFKEAGESAKRGFENLAFFIVFLSVSLGVLNLLPIPILDGGHLVFFTIEAIKGSPLSLGFYEICNRVGGLILLGLIIFALGNDILKLFNVNI